MSVHVTIEQAEFDHLRSEVERLTAELAADRDICRRCDVERDSRDFATVVDALGDVVDPEDGPVAWPMIVPLIKRLREQRDEARAAQR